MQNPEENKSIKGSKSWQRKSNQLAIEEAAKINLIEESNHEFLSHQQQQQQFDYDFLKFCEPLTHSTNIRSKENQKNKDDIMGRLQKFKEQLDNADRFIHLCGAGKPQYSLLNLVKRVPISTSCYLTTGLQQRGSSHSLKQSLKLCTPEGPPMSQYILRQMRNIKKHRKHKKTKAISPQADDGKEVTGSEMENSKRIGSTNMRNTSIGYFIANRGHVKPRSERGSNMKTSPGQRSFKLDKSIVKQKDEAEKNLKGGMLLRNNDFHCFGRASVKLNSQY